MQPNEQFKISPLKKIEKPGLLPQIYINQCSSRKDISVRIGMRIEDQICKASKIINIQFFVEKKVFS